MPRDRLALEGDVVNRKLIKRLMAILRIKVIYPARNLSKRNQVWSTDINYSAPGLHESTRKYDSEARACVEYRHDTWQSQRYLLFTSRYGGV